MNGEATDGNNAIFLVCDMINDLVHEDGPNGKKGLRPDTRAAQHDREHGRSDTQSAPAAGVKIGYVRVGFSPDYRECPPKSRIFQGAKKAGLFKLGEWGTEVHPALAPQPGDFDIVKHRVSPFYATTLEPILRANGIQRLYVCRACRRAVRCCPRRKTATTAITKCSCSKTAAPR